MRKLMLATLCVLIAITSAQAATISASPYLLGGTRILIRGPIVPGDEQQFRAVASTVSGVVVVALNSPGGSVAPAIAIGRMVRERGFMTLVGRPDSCASACTLIWLSGKHAVVQRNAYLGFHAPALPNGQYSPEGTAYVASYLKELGLTPAQIQYAIGTPQPLIHVATERDAAALGIHPQVVSSLFGVWRSCQAKYCLAIP